MAKDLITSSHDRQNILNNHHAFQQAEQYLVLGRMTFDSFIKDQLVALYGMKRQ